LFYRLYNNGATGKNIDSYQARSKDKCLLKTKNGLLVSKIRYKSNVLTIQVLKIAKILLRDYKFTHLPRNREVKMTFGNTDKMVDIEHTVGSAVRGLLEKNAEVTPANILTLLTIRSFSQNVDEAVRNSIAVKWIRNCLS